MDDLKCATKMIAKLFIFCSLNKNNGFEKILTEFCETASDSLYQKVREAVKSEKTINNFPQSTTMCIQHPHQNAVEWK